MEDGEGQTFMDQGVELDGEPDEDAEREVEMDDVLADTVPSDLFDEETRQLAAGLASLGESELLAALEAMQKAVIGSDGENVLVAYVLASPHCAEIVGAWERGAAAATAVPVMLLLYYMFRHPLGKVGGTHSGDYNYKSGLSITEKEAHRKVMAVKLRLDKLARSIVRTRMKDIYSHLSSSQKSRQNAALLLLSAIVLRGRALAIEIATSFDFTLEALRKLGHLPKQGVPKTGRAEGHRGILKQPTRVAFVELAISFLTVGDPGLLRWVLQKRPLWIGVLHGISKDDEKTIVQVLTLLQEKVMAPAFMVPRGLQSVLFGDATLEQLARISSDHSLGDAGELGHATLISLCTDPSHGLCPEETELLEAASVRNKSGAFGGGQGRLLRLMLRLKVTEVDRHRDVLLATARARPQLAISYLASFPLSLEPRVSPAWFNAMSLVSQLIPLASQPSSFSFLGAQFFSNGHLVQSILQSLLPSPLSRVVLNRGLLHVDFMVKHASLRVLVEALVCLRRLINAIGDASALEPAQRHSERSSAEFQGQTKRSSLVSSFKTGVIDESIKQELMKVSQSVQDFMRASLPDPNTLLAILSSLKLPRNSRTNTASISELQGSPPTKKRKRKEEQNSRGNDELKTSISELYDYDATVRLLWGLEVLETSQREGIEGLLYAKVVQVLAAYQVALPVAMADTGFDAFKLLPDDPSLLSTVQQRSLSALLLAATGSGTSLPLGEVGWVFGGFAGFGSAYKSFKQLLMFMLISEVKDVRDAVYEVAHRVMSSTGAFESNPMEISLWLDLLLQWKIEKSNISNDLEEIINVVRRGDIRPGSTYASLVEFLSEAVSSIGQNSYKYLDSLHSILSKYVLQEDTENSLLPRASLHGFNPSEFGPFAVCTIEKFIHIISKSKVPAARTTVALYLVNVLYRLLKHQINPQSLAMVIVTMISAERESLSPEQVKSPEWTVLLVLFERAQLLLSDDGKNDPRAVSAPSARNLGQGYQAAKVSEVLRGCRKDHDMTLDEKVSKVTSSMVCASMEELVNNFPLLMRFCMEDLEGDFSLPIALLGVHQGVLAKVATAWPELFTGGLRLALSVKHTSEDRLTVGNAKELRVMPGSTASTLETRGFCIFLLVAPFPVLFSAASFCRQPVLLTNQTFATFLQAGLLRLHRRNWLCMVRLIISGMKHLAASSVEDIGDGAAIHTCFSLICSLVLPIQRSPGGSFLPDELICSSRVWDGYEDVITDLLKHPALYNLFLHDDPKLIPSMTPCPFASDLRRDTKDENVCDTALRRTLASAASCVHPIDCHILSLLIQILNFTETMVKSATISSESHGTMGFLRKVLRVYKPYALKAINAFQKDVDDSSSAGLMPSPALFAVSALTPYTDPSLLLPVFLSLLSTKALKVKSSKQAVSPHVLGLHFVSVFVHSLSGAAPHLRNEAELSGSWTLDRNVETHSGGPSMYDLFEKVVEHVIGSPSIMADLCLLSFLEPPKLVRSPLLGFEMSFNNTSTGLACSTPLDVLRHCVCHPNKVTGRIALLLVETSVVHLTEFRRLIAVGTAERGPSTIKSSPGQGLAEMLLTHSVGNQKEEFVLSDQDLLYLLPAAQVYIVIESRRGDATGNEFVNYIASVYTKLLTKRLKKWGKFISERLAMDGLQDIELPLTPLQPLSDLYNMLMELYNSSSIGQVVYMLQSCQILLPFSMKLKTRLVQSLLPVDDTPLVTQDMLLSAGEDITPCMFEAVAKADIIRNVISSGFKSQVIQNVSEESGGQEMGEQTQTSDLESLEESSVWLKFLRSLMNTLGLLYKSKALDSDRKLDTNVTQTKSKAGRNHWIRFLEEYLLRQVTNAAERLAAASFKMSEYAPLYKHSMRTLLGHRYGETSAMKACRYLSFVVFQGLQSQIVLKDTGAGDDVLELLIAHSKFLPSLLVMDSKRMRIPHIAGKHVGKGTALNALSSVLSLIGSPILHISAKARSIVPDQDSEGEAKSVLNMTDVSRNSRDGGKYISDKGALDDVNRLEIVKLLRILLGVRLKQFTLGTMDVQSLPLDDVMSILLAAYGGTLSSVDVEIFLLMQEIESHGGLGFSGLSRLDYLWGEAALKRRKAKAEEVAMNVLKEPDNIDDIRRQTFKEDLLIDPRRCGLAVLLFPLKRKFGVADIGQLGLVNQNEERNEEISEQRPESNDEDLKDAAYDPAFLLPFSLHGLSIGCINAEEFVQLGLLAIAFASMSSAEESMRKAGYELLAKYYSVLEDGPSFKGRLQIRLLMTYVKNAVTEPWQRIPVVFSVFAAEASCILMHPESHQYAIINRFLLRAPSLDLESIPLFQVMFGSGSVQYRSDRLWMLRLLASGLRTSLDARVFRRKFVLELLMSFHDSSMADTFPRKWVLQVLHQAASVRSFSRYLVEHTGVLSWLSSVALNDIEGGLGLQDDRGSGQIASMALQVIERILSWGNLHRHSFLDCLEELSKAGHVFYHLTVRNPTHQFHNLFQRSIFKILLTLVSLSHKRRKHETHFTLNLGALVEVLHLVPGVKSPILHMEDKALALQLVLHAPPLPVNSYEDKLALVKVATWAQSVALELETGSTNGRSSSFVTSNNLTTASHVEESLSEKLLRWVAASVILGELAQEGKDVESREQVFKTLSVISCLKQSKFSERDTATKNLDEKLASLLLALEGHVSGKIEGTSLVPVATALIVLTRLTRSSIHPGGTSAEAQQKLQCILELLLLELPTPEGANISWQWSFNSPWTVRDESSQSTDDSAVQSLYVSEICRTIIILLQQILLRQGTHIAGLVHWESLLLVKPQSGNDSESDPMKLVRMKLQELQRRLCTALQRICSG
ncbi:unnamed protein product [Calypogeia fissa]